MFGPGFWLHRIPAWQGLAGTSVGHPAQSPAQAGSPRAGCTAPRPGGAGISPEKETPRGLGYPDHQAGQTNGNWVPDHLQVSISSAVVFVGTRILAGNFGGGGGAYGQRTIEIKGGAADQHHKANPASLAQETTYWRCKLGASRC